MTETIGKPLKICLPCSNGYYRECTQPVVDKELLLACGIVNTVIDDTKARQRGGQVKFPEDITDVQSTGRKRAAQMYPITEGMKCEWQSLARAGGGVIPSIGCHNGMASNVHHGPNKSTLDNRKENVHRICSKCHNRWHSANDEFYGTRPLGGEPFIPLNEFTWVWHDAETKASLEDVVKNELKYATRKDRRTP